MIRYILMLIVENVEGLKEWLFLDVLLIVPLKNLEINIKSLPNKNSEGIMHGSKTVMVNLTQPNKKTLFAEKQTL